MVGLGCCCTAVEEMSCFIAASIATCTYCLPSLTPTWHPSAGSTILKLCKAVLKGGEDGAQASLQLAALTLEGIQAKTRRQAELGVQSNTMLDPMRRVQRPLTPDCLAASLPLARWGQVYGNFNTHLDVHRSAYLSGLADFILSGPSTFPAHTTSALLLWSPWHWLGMPPSLSCFMQDQGGLLTIHGFAA